jgi:WD40 repeat protein
MNFSLDPQLLATSCVPQPHASSWYHHPAPNEAGLIAFAADKLVAIYQPGMAQSVRLVMHGHQERVNCVQWIPTSSPNLLLASVSADHSLCLWQLDIQTTAYSLLHRIADVHTAPIHSLAVLPAAEDEGKVFIATAGSDKTIAVWSYSVGSNDLRLVQRIQPRKGHAVSLAFSRLTEATPLLAVGTTDSLITLFSWSPNDAQVCALPHSNIHT